jgi:hypothetical protein
VFEVRICEVLPFGICVDYWMFCYGVSFQYAFFMVHRLYAEICIEIDLEVDIGYLPNAV